MIVLVSAAGVSVLPRLVRVFTGYRVLSTVLTMRVKVMRERKVGMCSPFVLRWALVAIVAVLLTGEALAELQQVSIGGELRIRGRWYINVFDSPTLRYGTNSTGWRPLGPKGTISGFKWDDKGGGWARYETATLLNVKADFSNSVSTFFELYDHSIWGENFRSSYLTGVDTKGDPAKNYLTMNQAYVDVSNLFGEPLRLRVGRQALKFDNGWLISDMLTPSQFLSFDGVRMTWTPSKEFTLDAFDMKLTENTTGDEDTDFYGLHATYTGIPALTVEGYYYFLRDAAHVETTKLDSVGEWVEGKLDVDQYGATELHTIGTHLWGKESGFDYDLNFAYQFGQAAHVGSYFVAKPLPYGDQNADYNTFGGSLTVGYTFKDVKFQPRPFVMGVFFDGQDNTDISFGDWLNPFYTPKASVSFNRLFSETNYVPTINDNGWMSNFAQATAGVEAQLTDCVRAHFHVAKDFVVDAFNPPPTWDINGVRVAKFPGLSFITEKGSHDMGWEVAAWVKYNYSADLSILLYGNYLWVGEALRQGAFVQGNGTAFNGGTGNKDNAGYVFWMTTLKF